MTATLLPSDVSTLLTENSSTREIVDAIRILVRADEQCVENGGRGKTVAHLIVSIRQQLPLKPLSWWEIRSRLLLLDPELLALMDLPNKNPKKLGLEYALVLVQLPKEVQMHINNESKLLGTQYARIAFLRAKVKEHHRPQEHSAEMITEKAGGQKVLPVAEPTALQDESLTSNADAAFQSFFSQLYLCSSPTNDQGSTRSPTKSHKTTKTGVIISGGSY